MRPFATGRLCVCCASSAVPDHLPDLELAPQVFVATRGPGGLGNRCISHDAVRQCCPGPPPLTSQTQREVCARQRANWFIRSRLNDWPSVFASARRNGVAPQASSPVQGCVQVCSGAMTLAGPRRAVARVRSHVFGRIHEGLAFGFNFADDDGSCPSQNSPSNRRTSAWSLSSVICIWSGASPCGKWSPSCEPSG